MQKKTNAREGALIVICGIDGSGKTLQSSRLYETLAERGYKAETIDFPRYEEGFFGEMIAGYLRGEISASAEKVNPYLASLPFACDRWEFRPKLLEWIDSGKIVICNRYVVANMAHQGCKIRAKQPRAKYYRWVEEMEYNVFKLPRPDLHIWLDIEPRHAMTLLEKKGERGYLKDSSDIHENLRHLEVARQAYSELSCMVSGWARVAGSGGDGPEDADVVAERVWDNVVKVLLRKAGDKK